MRKLIDLNGLQKKKKIRGYYDDKIYITQTNEKKVPPFAAEFEKCLILKFIIHFYYFFFCNICICYFIYYYIKKQHS